MSEFPTLVLAHRSNTIRWLDYAIEYKANAIETDIYLGNRGQVWASHDPVAPGTKIEEFIEHASQRLNESEQIVLWILDLKPSMTPEKVGELRSLVNENFPQNVWKFYCTSHSITGQIEPHLSQFGNFEGVNYDADQRWGGPNTTIEEAWEWKEKHQVKNFIYSAGLFAAGIGDRYLKRLEEAKKFRQSQLEFGIYTWTFENLSSSIEMLQTYELNGIMGNMNTAFGNLPKEINTGNVKGRRMATRSDGVDAFRFTIKGS